MSASDTQTTIDVVTRFENNFNTYDFDLVMSDMTDDAVFEHVAAEDKSIGRFEGREAVRAAFASLPEHFPNYTLGVVDVVGNGDRCAVQWTIQWDLPDGSKGELKGADFFRMRGDKICEKLSYLPVE
ncbi:MAG: nuclear transport factor 2 family protein [Phycisphaerales bacterium]